MSVRILNWKDAVSTAAQLGRTNRRLAVDIYYQLFERLEEMMPVLYSFRASQISGEFKETEKVIILYIGMLTK